MFAYNLLFLELLLAGTIPVKDQNIKTSEMSPTLQFGLTKEVNIELCVGRRGGSSFALCEAVRWSLWGLDN